MRRGSKLGVLEDHCLQTELVSLAYDAASDQDKWLVFLERLSDGLELTAATFLVLNTEPSRGQTRVPGVVGIDDAAIRDYEEHFGHLDPHRVPAGACPSGTVCSSSAVVPDEVFVHSEYFNDFYARNNMRYAFASLVDNDAGIVNALVCHRAPGHRAAGDEELRFLALLTPHLQRARTLSLQLGTLRNERRVASNLLDGLPVGLVFVDRSGRFLRANSRGEEILFEEDGLALRRGRLTASEACDVERLHEVVRNACDARHAINPAARLSTRLTRSFGRRALDVMACPIAPASLDWADERAAAFLVLSDGTAEIAGAALRLRELYGLSEVESQLAVAIADGATVKAQAAVRGVSVETVRWQLKQVFAKTGTTRQAELIRLVLLGPLIGRT